ncbi:GTPase domain-containing protein [uncultured Clostridium sp.]|jgi:GTPase Era involved in 16S rRNA processing|uniref:GTPase n=1 Tax=uncultured Clostridium sp. TaxID=59620 RepID=UPI0026219542|nr:GTPase domain-containing protein [uncultured Clostridium sp.]
MAIPLNLLVIGKTGSGKSALVNYIADANLTKVGAGSEVTQEVLKRFDYIHSGAKVAIYDTKAINLEESIETSILSTFATDRKRADFDLILYCMSAFQTSIEAKEIEKIVEIRKQNKNIIFVVTGDDIIKGENKELLGKIKDLGFKEADFVKVSSEEKEYLSGNTGNRYGKTELFESIKIKLREHISKSVIDEFTIVIERRVPMWNLRCKSELKNNKSLFVRKHEKRTEDELVKDFNLYLKETEDALNDELSSILKSIYRKYNFMYTEDVLEFCEDININSQLYLPDKLKKSYNFAIIDKIQKNLARHWSEAMKETISKFGV